MARWLTRTGQIVSETVSARWPLRTGAVLQESAAVAPVASGTAVLADITPSGTLSVIESDVTGSVTLDNITPTGSITPATADASGTATLDDITPTGTLSQASGIITSPVLKNNEGTILASVSGVVANVYNQTTGALVVRKTGLSSNGSGIVTFTDILIVPGTTYAYELDLSATSQGRRLPTGVAT